MPLVSLFTSGSLQGSSIPLFHKKHEYTFNPSSSCLPFSLLIQKQFPFILTILKEREREIERERDQCRETSPNRSADLALTFSSRSLCKHFAQTATFPLLQQEMCLDCLFVFQRPTLTGPCLTCHLGVELLSQIPAFSTFDMQLVELFHILLVFPHICAFVACFSGLFVLMNSCL